MASKKEEVTMAMMFEPDKLTEEQKKKLRTLMWSALKKQTLIGLKVCSMLFFANALIAAVGVLWVQSQTFIFIGSILNACFILPIIGRETRKENDRVNEEVKKILES
jgi:hypothetical protein